MPTQLRDVLQQTVFSGKTASECRALLDEQVTVRVNSTPYTWAGVTSALSRAGVQPPIIDAFVDGITDLPGGKAMNKSLESGGVDFSLAHVQAGLDAAADVLGAELVAVLKGLGVVKAPRWEQQGLAALPTTDQITAARAETEALQAKQALWSWSQQRYEVVQQAINNGSVVTMDEAATLYRGE